MIENDVVMLLVLLLSATALVVLISLVHHFFVDEKFARVRMSKRVQKLRLSLMLRFMGIPLRRYMMLVPMNTISVHANRCETCQSIQLCDECLKHGKYKGKMSFCPNYNSLQKLNRHTTGHFLSVN